MKAYLSYVKAATKSPYLNNRIYSEQVWALISLGLIYVGVSIAEPLKKLYTY